MKMQVYRDATIKPEKLYPSMQPIARFQGQATDVELARKEVKNVKAELVRLTTL